MKKQKLIQTALMLSVSAVMSVSAVSCGGTGALIVNPVNTFTVEKQDIENYISVSGKVEGSNVVNVTSEISAKVKTLNVEIGSSVREGDILCIFDSSELQKEYDELLKNSNRSDEQQKNQHDINMRNLEDAENDKESSLNKALKSVDRAVSARDSAYSKYDQLCRKADDYYNSYSEAYDKAYSDEGSEADIVRCQEYEQLYKQTCSERDALSEQLSSYDSAIDDAWDAYYSIESNSDSVIQSAKDVINAEKYSDDSSIDSQLEKLKEKIDKCTVKAPRDGIITALNVSEGSIPTKEAIMTIEDTSKLRINVTINETDILSIHEGQKAEITAVATGDAEFTGTVSRVVNIMSSTNNIYTGMETDGGYSAEITIDDKDSNLLIGMNAKVRIILDEKENVMAVPYDSISEDDNGEYSLFIAEKSGENYKAKKISVEKGLETNYLTEVSSSELKEGDLVITDIQFIVDGEIVTVAESYNGSQESE